MLEASKSSVVLAGEGREPIHRTCSQQRAQQREHSLSLASALYSSLSVCVQFIVANYAADGGCLDNDGKCLDAGALASHAR